MGKIRFVGLDVHAETIAAAVAEEGGEVRSLGTIPNRAEAIGKLIRKLQPVETVRACYEAGPTGYAVYWQLTALGVACQVVAPTLVPVRPGDRVKTDRRDAEKLARSHRAGELVAVWVPDPPHEALRDLVRVREAAKKDQLRARHRLSKFLLRHGLRAPAGAKAWGCKYMEWVRKLPFEYRAAEATYIDLLHEIDHARERIERIEAAIDEAIEQMPAATRGVVDALQALRGIARLSAVTIVAEVGQLSRFSKPSELMGYSGIVSSEHSSGSSTRRGRITKTGNAHLRRIVIESAWSSRYRPAMSYPLRKRQDGLPQHVKDIAWKAQHRLHERYCRLSARGLPKQKVVTAVGRELLGFIWAIAVEVERAGTATESTTAASA